MHEDLINNRYFIFVWLFLMQVADLKMLKEEGHKFESRYIDNLVGESNAFKRAFTFPLGIFIDCLNS